MLIPVCCNFTCSCLWLGAGVQVAVCAASVVARQQPGEGPGHGEAAGGTPRGGGPTAAGMRQGRHSTAEAADDI